MVASKSSFPFQFPPGERAYAARVQRLQGNETEKLAKVLASRGVEDQDWIDARIPRPPQAVSSDAGEAEGTFCDPTSVRAFIGRLEQLDESEVARLVAALGRKLYARGECVQGRMDDNTHAFLRDLAERHSDTEAISGAACVELADEVLTFASKEGKGTTPQTAKANIEALNAVYRELQPGLRASWASALEATPSDLLARLREEGVVSKRALRGISRKYVSELKPLVQLGLLTEVGDHMVFALAEAVDVEESNALWTAARLARMGDAVSENLQRWSVGLHLPGDDTESPLIHEARVRRIADSAGVSPAEVVAFLRMREQEGVLVRQEDGLRRSPQAAVHGLGLRQSRMAAIEALEAERRTSSLSEGILNASKVSRASKELRRLNYPTKDGGLPSLFLMDELLLGLEWLDTDLVERTLEAFDACEDPDKLMILSNALMGETGRRDKKAGRNLVPGFERLHEQVRALHHLTESAGANPLILLGGKDRITLDFMTSQQFLREMKFERALRQAEVCRDPSLKSAQTSLQRINQQSYEKLRESDPHRWQTIETLMKDVALPYIYKVGRDLMDSPQVFEKYGFRMTEFEILRDCAAHFEASEAAHASGDPEVIQAAEQAEAEVRALYQGIVDFEILELVLRKPEDALLQRTVPVVRDGVDLQFTKPDGTPGLSLWAYADFVMNPQTQYAPTTLLDAASNYVKSRKAEGYDAPDVFMAGGQGRSVFLYHDDTIILGLPSTQGLNGSVVERYAIDASSKMKNRLFSRRGNPMSGQIRIAGGMGPDGKKTGAYELEFSNPKIQQAIDKNIEEGKDPDEVSMLLISDFQVGSPTMRPADALRMFDKALAEGVDHIFIDGDVIQGWNYKNFAEESQALGLIHPVTQVDFISEIFAQIINKHVQALRWAHPDCSDEELADLLPTITITEGNHEWNTGDRYYSGEWLTSLRDRLAQDYPMGIRKEKVRYITHFENDSGDHIDYSTARFYDIEARTGIGVLGQHLYGGSKGNKLTSPAESHAAWARAKGIEMKDVHFTLGGHFHTSTIVESDGMFHVIAGALATQSGFEQGLGYSDGEPACGIFRFSSHDNPKMKLVTRRLVQGEEQARVLEGESGGLTEGMRELLAEYGSVEAYVEAMRIQFAQRGDRTQWLPPWKVSEKVSKNRKARPNA